jgi:hypothetical protein
MACQKLKFEAELMVVVGQTFSNMAAPVVRKASVAARKEKRKRESAFQAKREDFGTAKNLQAGSICTIA